MTYAAQLASITRTPIYLVRLTMDFCSRTFGTAPCNATGIKCYNTRPTCVFTTAYQKVAGGKVYKFTSADAPIPFKAGERPYLVSVSVLPTEINEKRTVLQRASLVFSDEPDGDVGIDPYLSSRSSVQGTFWTKFLARNPNYLGRLLEILVGFSGEPEANFQRIFYGKIQTMRYADHRLYLESADRGVDLSDEYWPPKLGLRLRTDISSSEPIISLTDVSDLPATGLICIEDEIIAYTAKNVAANSLTGCTRAQHGTTAAAHGANENVDRAIYYAPQKPHTQIALMFTDWGYTPNVEYKSTSLVALGTPDFKLPLTEAVICKPTKRFDLLAELLELADAYQWTNLDGQFEFARRVPNAPSRTYQYLSDASNIVLRTGRSDYREDARITRFLVYWHRFITTTDDEDTKYFARLDVGVSPDREAPEWYDKEYPEELFSRFLMSDSESPSEVHDRNVANFALRNVFRRRDTPIELQCDVELKDEGIRVGQFVRISTDEVVRIDGSPVSEQLFQCIKREYLDFQFRLTFRRLGLGNVAYVAPNSTPVFSSADSDDKVYGFIANDSPNYGMMDQIGNDGYVII